VASAKGNEIKASAGKLTDAETIIAAKDLLNKLGSGNTIHEDGFNDFNADVRSGYIANSTIAGVEQADVILLIGSNPRWESPVFNARLRKTWQDGAQVALLGAAVDLTYPYQHLGSDPAALNQVWRVGKLTCGELLLSSMLIFVHHFVFS
jgi:NADH dehydrogenase (ubiquinone) Fe-S protein 1